MRRCATETTLAEYRDRDCQRGFPFFSLWGDEAANESGQGEAAESQSQPVAARVGAASKD
jgi:hypothetical protein